MPATPTQPVVTPEDVRLIDDTRLRLLTVAGHVFADRGYEQTTVREVCDQADANIAAVSYHFGGKMELYRATIRHFMEAAAARHPMDVARDANRPPEQRLEAFVRAMLGRIFDDGPCSYHGKLMARELLDPTEVLDDHIDNVVRPTARELTDIVAALTGLTDPLLLRQGMESVIGQILFQKHGCPVIERLHPNDPVPAGGLDAMARHITAFSLAGLQGMKVLGRRD
jgi:AcrR family transcriptional regulator